MKIKDAELADHLRTKTLHEIQYITGSKPTFKHKHRVISGTIEEIEAAIRSHFTERDKA
jgi:hypothetical protein